VSAPFEILIVDDDLGLAATLRDLLSEEGYSAAVAANADEAVRLLDENHVTRVADDDLTRARDGGTDLRGADGPADEVLVSGDHQRRRDDARQPATQVEARDLLAENPESVAIDRLGPERIQIAGLHGTEVRKVQWHLTKDDVS